MRGHRWTDDAAAQAALKAFVPKSMGDAFALIEQGMLRGPWVMGEAYTICDPYLFTLARWLEGDGVDLSRAAAGAGASAADGRPAGGAAGPGGEAVSRASADHAARPRRNGLANPSRSLTAIEKTREEAMLTTESGKFVQASVVATGPWPRAWRGRPSPSPDPKIGWLPALTGASLLDRHRHRPWPRLRRGRDQCRRRHQRPQARVITRDTQSDPTKAVNAASELTRSEKVNVLYGPGNSGEALACTAVIAGRARRRSTPASSTS